MSRNKQPGLQHTVGDRAAVGVDVEIAARCPVAPCRAILHGQIRHECIGMIENKDTPISVLVVCLHCIGDNHPRRIWIFAENANGGNHVQWIRDCVQAFGDVNRRAVGSECQRGGDGLGGGRRRGIRRRCVFCRDIDVHIAVVERRKGVGDGVRREDASTHHCRRSSREPLVCHAIAKVVYASRKCLSRRSRAERKLRPVFAVGAVEH